MIGKGIVEPGVVDHHVVFGALIALAALAYWLGANKARWRGTLVFVGQPAEEKALLDYIEGVKR